MKVLIVDDSKPIRSVMSKMLKKMGMEVLQAKHGLDALSVLNEHEDIGLITVDWNMPEMNGIDLLDAIREKDPEKPKPTIVMVSTENETSKIQKAITKGANEYIMKPFTQEILEEKLALLGIGGK